MLALTILSVLLGCAKNAQQNVCRPNDLGRCIIEDVDVVDNRHVDDSDIEGRIATTETSHLLGGIFKEVPVLSILDVASVEYERFDRFVLERDLARVERYYKARGYYEAHVRAGRVTRRADGRVRIEIAVDEGTPVKIGRIDLEWRDWALSRSSDPDETDALREATKLVTDAKNNLALGDLFEEEKYEATKKLILRAMTDHGFAYANVEGKAYVDLPRHEVQIVFTIELGPYCRFGDVSIVGLGELPEAPIRNAIGISKGDEFSTDAMDEAEIALADLGVFGAVDVQPQLTAPDAPKNPVVPVVFEVQPSAMRAVKLGVGAEIGSIVEAHLLGGWENRNFLGGLRRFSVEARPGLVLYPLTIDKVFSEQPDQVLPQLRLRFELRQPVPFDTRTSARLSGEFNLYSLWQGGDDRPDLVFGYLPGYRTYSGTFGFDRSFLKSRVHVGLFYNIELNDPFSYNSVALPAGYQTLLIPSLQAIGSLDLRENAQGEPDAVNPNRGIYIKTDLQLAGHFLGGDADDIRISPEFRGYVPISKKVTLAFRAATGFILPTNYAKECSPPYLAPCTPRDIQILELRGFFSGGANSNRGYNYRGVGPHLDLSKSLLPLGESTAGFAEGESVPIGGLTLWEASAELRFPIAGALGGAFFLDGSDVSPESGIRMLRFTRPHLSAGLGLRYATPVGPARLDVGYRIPYAQVLGASSAKDFPEGEGDPGNFAGLPIAVSLGIGEAF